ncbi:MAG: sigma-70 family RNA polymerase sigma factor [Planctomycetes bacterium]|nr:sigma-70 family RNA polymerase sigma factor [Planctomycetota bacterium]
MIEGIVRDKDREAFAELFRRFEGPAYQLALHLTDRPALAEEAVQDAMLAVWYGAESFRPDGDLRRWILGIVAHRAMRAARKERKSTKAMVYERERQRTAPERQRTEEGAERREVLGALHDLLSRLPDLERKLVALYYGAGMSQEEIGAALDMPQRTVSFKLQACLERLRKSLAQAGMAAAAPLLTPQLIGTVLSTGPAVPQGLLARTLARCDTAYAPRESGARSARAAAAGSSKAVAAAAAIAVLLAACAYVTWGRTPSPTQSSGYKAMPPDAALPAVSEAPADLRTWTFKFDQALPEGLVYIQGEWRTGLGGADRQPALITGDRSNYNTFLLPRLNQRLPLAARVRFRAQHPGRTNLGLGWSDGKQSFSARRWEGEAFKPSLLKGAEFVTYYFGSYAVSTSGDWIGPVSLDQEPVARDFLFVTADNAAVFGVEIQELRMEDIPARVRDVEGLIRGRKESPEGVKGYRWEGARPQPLAEYLKEQAEME